MCFDELARKFVNLTTQTYLPGRYAFSDHQYREDRRHKMTPEYTTIEALDEIRVKVFSLITGISELMNEFAQDSLAVREELIREKKAPGPGQMSSLLILILKARTDAVPSLSWFETPNVGPWTDRKPRWKRIPMDQKFGYSKRLLKRTAASPEEFERCWELEQYACTLRASLAQISSIIESVGRLEKCIRDVEFIVPQEKSSFDRRALLTGWFGEHQE